MKNNSLYSYEKELVRHLKCNHKEAFEYIHAHYGPGLYGVVCKIVKDNIKAEDVMQDAFLKIWTNIRLYDVEKGTLFTWMLNITRNTAIDMLRTDRKFEKNIGWASVLETDLSASMIFTPLPALIDLTHIIESLGNEKKQLIKMVYLQGYTHQEVSERLSLPLGTVKSRIRKGLQELRIIFSVTNADLQFV